MGVAIIFVVAVGYTAYRAMKQGGGEEVEEDVEKTPPAPENGMDADDMRILQSMKHVREKDADAKREKYREFLLSVVELGQEINSYSSRKLADALGISKDEAAAITATLYEMGVLVLRGQDKRSGYKFSGNDRMLKCRFPLPEWDIPR